MIDLTARHGTIVLSVHNHKNIFDKIPRVEANDSESFYNPFLFDSLNWSYKEPATGDTYYCIAPHIDLIIDTFLPHFKHFNRLTYPRVSSKELLVFRGKDGFR